MIHVGPRRNRIINTTSKLAMFIQLAISLRLKINIAYIDLGINNMAGRYMCMLSLLIAVLAVLLQNHTGIARPINITVDEGEMRATSKANPPPSTTIGLFAVNHYKNTEIDAFRPTSPGHSPGVGHGSPPAT